MIDKDDYANKTREHAKSHRTQITLTIHTTAAFIGKDREEIEQWGKQFIGPGLLHENGHNFWRFTHAAAKPWDARESKGVSESLHGR
jgi:hypothetical protein